MHKVTKAQRIELQVNQTTVVYFGDANVHERHLSALLCKALCTVRREGGKERKRKRGREGERIENRLIVVLKFRITLQYVDVTFVRLNRPVCFGRARAPARLYNTNIAFDNTISI